MEAIDYAIAQRNRALDESIAILVQRDQTAQQLRETTSSREAAFKALHDCIKSGHVPNEDTPQLVESVPGFSEWIKALDEKDRGG